METTFGTRLRQQRERQCIELTAIAEQTKIQRSLLEALERDDLSRWPAGIFRRAWVRDYALAIGLDGDAVVRELYTVYPEEPETVEAIASAMRVSSSPGARLAQTLNFTSWLRGGTKTQDATQPERRQDVPRAVRADSEAVAPAPPPPAAAPRPAALTHREIAPLLGEAARRLEAVGLVLWSWDPRSAVLRPSYGHGYAPAVLSTFPDLPSDAENAVGAAFRRAETCVVEGGEDMTGALTIPLMAAAGCVGVLALEFRNGVEVRESVRAAAATLAADVASLVTRAPRQQSSVA